MSFERCSYSCLKAAQSENGWLFYYIEEVTSTHFIVYTGDRRTNLYSIVKGSEATDFNTNFKSGAISVTSDGAAQSKINSGVFHIFDDESVGTTYEDSMTVGCDGSKKTITIENKSVSLGLYYKLWGSADGVEFEEIVGQTLLALSSKITIVNNDYWKFVKVQARSVSGTVTVNAYLQVGI